MWLSMLLEPVKGSTNNNVEVPVAIVLLTRCQTAFFQTVVYVECCVLLVKSALV